jgi:hypothetical protein
LLGVTRALLQVPPVNGVKRMVRSAIEGKQGV